MRETQVHHTLEVLTSQLASVSASVEAQEEVLDTLTEQTEACVQKLVETEAQKEFMRYAFLKEPKSLIGKMVSDNWNNNGAGKIPTSILKWKY